ncbi:MAG: dTDP-4-dehydrorhamnose reductase, partial [Pseudomonadota bacterium]|nr:dTDP-4-dehydrorhamnose reductase [Pseudomonadota bacterium]
MYLITGSQGQLGTELSKLLPQAIRTDVKTLDITDATAVKNFVTAHNVDTIINCAAYTAVDKAEDDLELAAKINIDGPRNLAESGAKIIHISTDYVFDGTGYKPYEPEDKANPVSVYGKTKLAGEQAVFEKAREAVIIRTAWLYSPYGNNFVKTMRKLGIERESLNVVCDQIGTPTCAADLAAAIVKIIPQMNEQNKGVYHFTNEGVCSWYDFAHEIMALSGISCRVNPIPSSAYPTKAKRPFYSV